MREPDKRLEEIENFLAFAERVHERRAPRAHVAQQKTEQRGVILQPRQLGENDAQILGALGNFDAGEFLDAERVGPVVGHRAKIIEPIGVRHRAEVARVLADFLVVAMQITENRFELANDLAVERHIHPKHAVRGWMLRSHRDFEQFAVESRSHRYRWSLHCFECFNGGAHSNCRAKESQGLHGF